MYKSDENIRSCKDCKHYAERHMDRTGYAHFHKRYSRLGQNGQRCARNLSWLAKAMAQQWGLYLLDAH